MTPTLTLRRLAAATAVVGAVSVGIGVAASGAAGASTPSSPSTSAAARHPGLAHWLRAHRRLRVAVADLVAKDVGLTPAALRAELHSGKSIAEVATEHNVSVTSVTTSLVTAADARIDAAVAAGTVTSERAGILKARVPTLAEKLVGHQFGQH
jgi:hypothetical protein